MSTIASDKIEFTRPGNFKIAKAIGYVTFREIIRDKILYTAVVCGILMMCASSVATQLTFVNQTRVLLNLGLSTVYLASLFTAILIGASLIEKEFDRRTAFVALAKPINRTQFFLGKYVGLSGVLSVNWALLTAVYLTNLLFSGGELTQTLCIALFFALLQSLLMAAIVLMFSAATTPTLSVLFSFGAYLIGVNLSQMELVAAKSDPGVMKFILEWFATLFPNFEQLNIGLKVDL